MNRTSLMASALLGALWLAPTGAYAQDAGPEREPPGAKPPPPTTMDAIAAAAGAPYQPKPMGHMVKFNLEEADLAELVNHISGLTGKRFIYGAKLRQIKATVVSPTPVTLAEAYAAFLSILQANGLTVIPEGRFLKIVDSAGATSQGTPVYSPGSPVPDEARYVTRLYRPKYIDPNEAVNVLGKFKTKEGDVTSVPSSQLLILTDTGSNIERMMRLLEEIDVGGAGAQMWVEPVTHGSAREMAARVNELFEVGGQGGSGLTKVVADEQTNSIVVVGTEESYLRLLELLKRLDTMPASGGKVHVLRLQHSDAEELANTLDRVIGGGGGKGAPGSPEAAQSIFEGRVIVVADKSTNSLVVTSSGRDYATLRLVVEELDRARRQVFIEAVVMDLGVSDSIDLGLSYHAGDVVGTGDEQSLVYGGLNPLNTIMAPDPTQLQGAALGLRGPEIPGSKNFFGVSVPAFGVVVHALASSGKANVMATPHIIATDNIAAEINVGENIPLQTNVGSASNLTALSSAAGGESGVNAALLGGLGGVGFAAPRQDVGNKIKVTPHINESSQVRLEIEQESSAAGEPTGGLGVVSIKKRTAKTTVVVEDGQTVIIGGLMRDETITSKEKIPVLGDLPVLGFLFRSTKDTMRKSNLLLILTPYVVRDQRDMRRIFERKMQERQEFLDRYFVFSAKDWEPPANYRYTNELVEQTRQEHFQAESRLRLEEASASYTDGSQREPSAPISLPAEAKMGGAAGPQGAAAPAPAPKPVSAPRSYAIPTNAGRPGQRRPAKTE